MNDAAGTYVIAAAGTGGHIFPGIALAREIEARRPASRVVFVGTAEGLETRLVPEAGFALELVPASGFAGKPWNERLAALGRLPVGFFEARRLLLRHRARAVAGVGGYVTVAVVTAAHTLRIPTLIHESNALPGIANRFLNCIATRTAVGLEAANAHFRRPGTVTGTPVRPEFFRVRPQGQAMERRVLVFGGSQGSRVLNRAMAGAAPVLSGAGLEVIHQTGERNLAETQELYGRVPANWRLAAFLPRPYEELAWADLVVSRSGALTTAELAAAGRPAILIPFGASTHGHQLENARALSRVGAAMVIEESELFPEALAGVIRDLLSDRGRLAAMAESARLLARPQATQQLASLLFEAETAR